MNAVQRQSRFDQDDELVVMKFGGTSVQDAAAIERLIGIVKSRSSERPGESYGSTFAGRAIGSKGAFRGGAGSRTTHLCSARRSGGQPDSGLCIRQSQ